MVVIWNPEQPQLNALNSVQIAVKNYPFGYTEKIVDSMAPTDNIKTSPLYNILT